MSRSERRHTQRWYRSGGHATLFFLCRVLARLPSPCPTPPCPAQDWGLLRWRSRNRLLRDALLFRRKLSYWGAIAFDLVGRFFWAVTVSNQLIFTNQLLLGVFAGAEIVRRIVWCIFRIESESVNNIERFRKVNFVPVLPLGGMPHIDLLSFPRRPHFVAHAPGLLHADVPPDYEARQRALASSDVLALPAPADCDLVESPRERPETPREER